MHQLTLENPTSQTTEHRITLHEHSTAQHSAAQHTAQHSTNWNKNTVFAGRNLPSQCSSNRSIIAKRGRVVDDVLEAGAVAGEVILVVSVVVAVVSVVVFVVVSVVVSVVSIPVPVVVVSVTVAVLVVTAGQEGGSIEFSQTWQITNLAPFVWCTLFVIAVLNRKPPLKLVEHPATVSSKEIKLAVVSCKPRCFAAA